MSGTSVQSMHGVLHRALEDAERMGLVRGNVAKRVKALKRDTAERAVFTEEQAGLFLAAAKGDPYEALYILALTTGMREGELLGLKWSDLRLTDTPPSLNVRLGVQEAERGYVLAAPKTEHSKRRIVLTAMAVEALRQHRVKQDLARLHLGEAWRDLDLVFPTTVGTLMMPNHLATRRFRRVLVKAGLPVTPFHVMRHTAATLMLMRGVPVKVVSEMLGHADISITLHIYSHVLEGADQLAADAMDKMFG